MGWRPASCCPRRSPSLLPVLTRGAATSPPGLAALCRALTSLRGLRLARSPLRYRIASPTSRSEPRLLSARPLRGSALPAYRSPTLCVVAPPSPLLPDGLPSSVPPPPLPGSRPGHLLPYGIAASASDSLCPRFPLSSLPDGLPPLSPTLCAVASLSPPAGWAAASVSDSLCRRFPLSSCRMGCCLCLRPPRSPPLCAVAAPSPHAGWDVVLGAAERAGRCYPRFGAERRPPATRQRGGGARRVDRGRGARPHSAELRSMRDQPPAPARATHHHIASVPSIPAPSPRHDARRAAWWGLQIAR